MTRASCFASGDKVSPVLNKTTGVTSYTGLECASFCWQGFYATVHTGSTAFHTVLSESVQSHTQISHFKVDKFIHALTKQYFKSVSSRGLYLLEDFWKKFSPVAGEPGGPGCPAGPCGPAGPMGPTLPRSPFPPWNTINTIWKILIWLFLYIMF